MLHFQFFVCLSSECNPMSAVLANRMTMRYRGYKDRDTNEKQDQVGIFLHT